MTRPTHPDRDGGASLDIRLYKFRIGAPGQYGAWYTGEELLAIGRVELHLGPGCRVVKK